ncbi:MAG: PEP-CTERM sorting domain-containing protein [Pseudomonadota bacterium]
MLRHAISALVIGASAAIGSAAAAPIMFNLGSHPDGSENPPAYGLRLDGIENFATGNGGSSATWTFDFDCVGCSVTGLYDDADDSFTISGLAFGGKDSGASYAGGGGFVTLDFVYTNVGGNPLTGEFSINGLTPKSSTSQGSGSISFIDANQSIGAGTTIGLLGYTDKNGNLVNFLNNQHRLEDECDGAPDPAFCDSPVGEGWLALVNDAGEVYHTTAQDWLFVSTPVSEPGVIGLFGLGLLGLGFAARRRA